MAKVTLIFKDARDGSVNIKAIFNPTIDPKESGSPAQALAVQVVKATLEENAGKEADSHG